MSPLERSNSRRIWWSPVLGLCLALLLGAAARAAGSVEMRPQAGSMMVASSASDSQPASAEDCRTCAACAIAPAPSGYGFTGEAEARENEPETWSKRAVSQPASAWYFDAGDGRLRWPVRIASCRWLD